jgi:hypothetical protein
MMVYPIAVLADEHRTALFAYSKRRPDGSLAPDYEFEKKHHDLMCEASELFWSDDDVFDFVMDHHGLEIGLTGTRVKSVPGDEMSVPKKGLPLSRRTEFDPETGEVAPGESPEGQPLRAHQAKIEIKSKHLKLTI